MKILNSLFISFILSSTVFSQSPELYIKNDTVFHTSKNLTFSIDIKTIEEIINSTQYANTKSALIALDTDLPKIKEKGGTISRSEIIAESAASFSHDKDVNTLIEAYLLAELNYKLNPIEWELMDKDYKFLHNQIYWDERRGLSVVFFLVIEEPDGSLTKLKKISYDGTTFTESFE